MVWLVTHLSVDRIDKLRALCSQWQGPVAASVWIQPTLGRRDRRTALGAILQLVSDVRNDRTTFSCSLFVVRAENLYQEGAGWVPGLGLGLGRAGAVVPPSRSVLSPHLYPVNALRGAATDIVWDVCRCWEGQQGLGATDRAVLLVVDVDMRPPDLLCLALAPRQQQQGSGGAGAGDESSLLAAVERLCLRDGAFLVLPALEIAEPPPSSSSSSSLVGPLLQSPDQQALRALLQAAGSRQAVRAFHAVSYPRGHGATLTDLWLSRVTAPSSPSSPPPAGPEYTLTYEEGWEPYGLLGLRVLRRTGGFNRCFVGWHRDKIEFVRRLDANGVRFTVCADVRTFLLDWQPHQATADRRSNMKEGIKLGSIL